MTEETLPTITCQNPKCGCTSSKRVLRPVKCPRCGHAYKHEEKKPE